MISGKHFLRRCFITGLVVWLPLWVVFAIIGFIIHLLNSTFALLPEPYQPHQLFGYTIPGLGIILTLIVLFLTGLIVNYFYGNYLVAAWERLMMRIPFVRSIYAAVKQVMDTFTHKQSESFRKVLLVEYPRTGIYTIGFQTAHRFQMKPIPDELITVFIPTTPLPTAGFLILVPQQDVIELDMTVEAAFKMIISLGVIKPKESELLKS